IRRYQGIKYLLTPTSYIKIKVEQVFYEQILSNRGCRRMKEKRWRVLIVDDELRIGMLIKKLIKWNELDMECIDVMDNGETALHVIKEEIPDIVITDIRMPKINGLDLICMTRDISEKVKFIVVSGYKEFEYAHRALQYGVDDYLLKPINENELNTVLKKIYDELDMLENKSIEKREMQKKVSESKQIIKRDFLKNIIEQDEDLELENAGIPLTGDIYRGIDIKLDYVDYNKSDKKQDRLTVERVIAIVEKILKGVTEEVLICEKENLHLYCLFNYNYSQRKLVKNSINDILSEIKEYLIGFELYEVTIGVGREKTEFGEIRFSMKESWRAVENRIKAGTGRLIYTGLKTGDNGEQGKDCVEKYRENFWSSIESYSRENLEQCINQIYSNFMLCDDMDFSMCYRVADELIEMFFERIDMHQEELRQVRRRLQGNCQHCYSIPQLKNLLKIELGNYLDMSREAIEAESAKPVRQARQYINQHYGEKIVLEDIADIVGLNPVYFSVLFKKETGINFSAYLVNVRLEKAKEMLCSTNETIAAVGESVGYRDSRYFSQIFTKTVGVKPVLYRKLHS
uniref:response regulator transcription factor n=1 Tax=Muricomes intestini TaxID=1796634 RepID=UPI002FE002E6